MRGRWELTGPTDTTMTTTHDARRGSTGSWGLFAALVAAMWLLVGIFEGALWVILIPAQGGKIEWRALALGIVGFWGLAALLTPALVWVACHAPFERGRRLRSALAYLATLIAFIPLMGVLRQAWILWVLKQAAPFNLRTIIRLFPELISFQIGGPILVFLVVMGACQAWDFYQRYRERERAAAALELEQARLRASLSEARLETLQMQLQPHFLFNALHAISTLILKGDSRGANEMLSHLSRFLRMTLDRADSPTVPLAAELDALDAYLRIQRERFRDRLHVAMEIDDRAVSAAVPNLVFQPLVENSIRHGIGSEIGSGMIVVRAAVAGDRLTLEVEDDGHGLPYGTVPANGIGLANVRERLEQLYPGTHEFTLRERPGGGTIARIAIPFRHAGPDPATRAD
jgi:two-component system, LytTR family, sensor kinase